MSISRDIVRTYRAPRRVLRGRVTGGAREDRALAVLFGACLLIFVSRWPVAAREAFLDPAVPLEARLGGSLIALLFVLPLLCYALAALTRVVGQLLGGKASWFEARMALFWAMLASSPLWLLYGLVEGFVGPGPALGIVEFLTFTALVVFWGAGLWEVETKRA